MIRSIQRAKPKIKQKATVDIKPAPPSINLVFNALCIPVSSVTTSVSTASSVVAVAAESTTASLAGAAGAVS